MPARNAVRSTLPRVLEPFDRQLTALERRAIPVAALGSVLLHAALLSLPLGSIQSGRGAEAAVAGSVIRALLRAEEPEPIRAPEPELPSAQLKPAAAPEPEAAPKPPAEETKPAARPGATRDSTDRAAIPATFFDPALLNQQPRPLREPNFELLTPILAREGGVRLVLYIDESGKVERVEIGSATLPPAATERVAQIFAALPFSPGRIDGTAVKTRVHITVGAVERTKEN